MEHGLFGVFLCFLFFVTVSLFFRNGQKVKTLREIR